MGSIEIAEAAKGIWSVRRRGSSRAAFIVKTHPGAVLIDAGPEPSGASVMLAFQKARVGLRSIRAILLTSADPEASAGARALRERSGARLLSPVSVAARLSPFEVDGRIEVGDRIEGRFEAIGSERGEIALRLLGSDCLFEDGTLRLNAFRRS